MQLVIRNKWITLRGSSYVKDIEGNDVYRVQGRFFTFTRKKFLKDMQGKDLYMIRNKFWRLFHRRALVYDMDGNIVARIRRKIFSFHDHYDVESTRGQITLRGNILRFDYHILVDGKEVGHIARKISLRDSFVLDIDDSFKDVPFIVALVICIDNITDEIRDDASSYSSN